MCKWKNSQLSRCVLVVALSAMGVQSSIAQKGGRAKEQQEPVLSFPPELPGRVPCVTVESRELLVPPPTSTGDFIVATEPPRIDLLYFPGQDYQGKPWSSWGDSIVANGKYYASIGDHLAPQGNAFVFEYDANAKSFRLLADVAKTLELPSGHYVPGKIHTRLDMGSDGWIYFGTHRGSTRVTNDKHHYLGDWIMRTDPVSGDCEVVDRNPVAKHCIPTSIVDRQRMIFFGSTAPGSDAQLNEIQFFAYDLKNRRTIYSGANGPSRSIILSRATGRVYFTPDSNDTPLMRFDPASDREPRVIPGKIGIRAASRETDDDMVYTVSAGRKGTTPTLYAFNTRTEQITSLGSAAVGTQSYITTLDVDPSGRFLYYIPGAHGGAYRDGTPIVQFDIRTKRKKVLAFLEPYFAKQFNCSLRGTYSAAVSEEGDKLFVTWNASRGSRHWDCCALTVIHIPASER